MSNNDLGIDTYKPADKPMYYGGNNHGSIAAINGVWYVFYHRYTNGTNFSRQGCLEPIGILPDGTIPRAEKTSCGPNDGAYMDNRYPKITQDGKDGDEETGYIANMTDCATAGFKYFRCSGIRRITIKVRGYCRGAFEVKTAWDGPALATIPVDFTNVCKEYSSDISVPDGIQALYFTYAVSGRASLASFALE